MSDIDCDRPWQDNDLITSAALGFLGAAAVVASWLVASASVSVGSQVAWLNVAICGLVVAAVAACLWLMRVRGRIGQRRRALVALEPVELAVPIRHIAAGPLVRAAGMLRVHHADCPLVAGKQVEPARRGDGESCGMCMP